MPGNRLFSLHTRLLANLIQPLVLYITYMLVIPKAVYFPQTSP